MARQQSVRVYSDKLDLLTETDVYQSLMFERSYHNIGEFEIHINRYMQGAEHFVRGNVISIGKNGYKGGIIHTQEIELDELGRETETFIVKGESLDSIMSRRITIPPAGKSHDRITASAEEVMKHYVQANFINATDTDRILERFKVADIRGLGEKITWESRYRNIANELNDISVRTNVGWGVYVDFETRMFVFDVFQAKDLTKGNDEGNSPVFFSPEFDSIKSQRFIDSEADYKNVAYIGGQGEGVERRVVQLNEDVGWERYEEFVDARDIGDKDEETDEELTEEEVDQLLAKRGTEKLADLGRLLSLEAEIITPIANRSTFQYERDYDLGDKVEVYNRSWGLTMEAPIVKVTEIYEEGGFTLEATFGEDRPTFLTKIKRRFDRLEGVDMQEAPDKVAVKRMNESKEHTDQEIHKTVEYVDEQDDKYDKKATDYTNQETERTLRDAVNEAVRQDDLVREDAMAAAQKAEENAISKSVAKEIYNAQVDEILKSLDDVDGVVTQQNVRIGEVSDKVTGFEVKINKYDGKFVSYDETINELEGKVTTSIEKVEGFGNKVEANTTEITKQAGMIAAKLDETTYTKDKDGMVKDIASNKAEIEATAKEVSSKVSRDEFDSLEIGGGNLLTNDVDRWSNYGGSVVNTTTVDMSDEWGIKEATRMTTTGGTNTIKALFTTSGRFSMAIDQYYTYSIYIKNVGETSVRFWINGLIKKGSTSSRQYVEIPPNKSKRYVFTGTRRTAYDWFQPRFQTLAGDENLNDSIDVIIAHEQAEKGTKATAYQPAYEDVDTRIDHAETEIKQNADEIALRATKDEVDKERVKINKAQTDITANANAISLRATTSQLNTEKKRITTAEGRIDVLDNAVKLKASQEDVDGLEGRVTKAEGELKVLPGEISAKVSKDGVISAINLTKEKAKIQAAQIDLVGAVTANHIKSLSGLNVNDQFIVSPKGDVTFGGDLKGASGTFAGEIESSKLVIKRSSGKTDWQDFGLQIESLVPTYDMNNPFKRNGFVNIRTYQNAVEIDRQDDKGNDIPLEAFMVDADLTRFQGKMELMPLRKTGAGGDLLSLQGNDADHVYIEFFRKWTRNAYIGIPSSSSDNFIINAHDIPGTLKLDGANVEVMKRLINQKTRDTTTTASANVYVASNGYFARSSSARKYKLLEQPIKVDPYKILDIQPKDWYDKGQAEELAEQLDLEFKGEETDFESLDTTKIKRIAGLVAEDVEDAGLGQYVIYEDDGTVEGVQYDRLWTLLIPIVKEQNEIINELKVEIKTLKETVK